MGTELTNFSNKPELLSTTQKSDFFINNFEKIIIPYIADGNPSSDTIAAYYSSIRNFISWCEYNNINPLGVTENHMIIYRSNLVEREYAPTAIAANFAALRKFFFAAIKLGLISKNPMDDINTPAYLRNRGNQINLGKK